MRAATDRFGGISASPAGRDSGRGASRETLRRPDGRIGSFQALADGIHSMFASTDPPECPRSQDTESTDERGWPRR